MAFSPSQLKFHVKADLSDRPRVEGKLAQGQKELAAENKRIAFVTQEFVVKNIESKYKRPLVSTGRLAQVTALPGNAYASAFYIGVGNPYFLDKSIAKYWRTIEEGSELTWHKRSFLTLDLRGTFGATLQGGRAGPGYSTPRGAGESDHGGKFLPTGKFWKHPETGKRYRMPVFHPTHEIAPMRAYVLAFQEARFPESAIEAARTYLDEVLIRPLR
jgi:hypothetical protein